MEVLEGEDTESGEWSNPAWQKGVGVSARQARASPKGNQRVSIQ